MSRRHLGKLVLAPLLAVFVFHTDEASATSTGRPADERAIVAAVTSFWQGWERGDRGQVQRNLAAAYVDVDADGVRREANEVLAFVETPRPEDSVAISTRNHKVLFLAASVAHVSYQVEDCRGAAARRACYRFVASDTFVRHSGTWKLAAGHQITSPAAAPDQAAVAKEEVSTALLAIAAAQLASDVDTFARLNTADWRLTHGRGQVVDRNIFANDMRIFWKPTAINYAEQAIRLGRDSAVVEGVVTFRWLNAQGQPREAVERHLDVFVRQYGRWRRSASALSCVSGDCA